jgi:hypothetical protein
MHRTGVSVLIVVLGMTAAGCGKYPVSLRTRSDVSRASAATDDIWLLLPVEDYTSLAKFRELKTVRFPVLNEPPCTDEKLAALAGLDVPNIRDVSFYSNWVTDKGILSLARMPSLQGLSIHDAPKVTDASLESLAQLTSLESLVLAGSSITDVGCELLAARSRVKWVDVHNCPKVTLSGLLKLVGSSTIEHVSFSADHLTTADIVKLINASRQVKELYIHNPSGEFNAAAIERAAMVKSMQVLKVIRSPGGEFDTVTELTAKE